MVGEAGHVFNHSHTSSGGAYIERVAQYDRFLRDGFPSGPARPAVAAAANSGDGSDDWWTQLQGYYSIMSPGKNTICVGSVNANDLHYAPQASMGPTLDGRIKPDLVAPGHLDYRPLDGMEVSFEEIRLHAVPESGADDLVLRFDCPNDPTGTSGWSAPAAGVLSVRTFCDEADEFVLETDGVAAANYEKLTFRMKLDVEHGDAHRRPRDYVLRWARDGDGRPDVHLSPRFEEVEKDGQWRSFEFDLSSEPALWRDRFYRMTLRPVFYDDRIQMPWRGQGYWGNNGTSAAVDDQGAADPHGD